MNVFQDYAKYYDLLYKDKNYEQEVNYIESLIKKYSKNSKSILELGCGTGKHALLLGQKGYEVCGVDISAKMVEQAKKRFEEYKGLENKVSFHHGDMRSFKINKTFDTVVSLFHVMSYQTTNKDLLNSFLTASKHLEKDGVFIFDCWYGPAVLSDKPSDRIKKIEKDNFLLTRVANSKMNANDNIVDVNYKICIQDKKSGIENRFEEVHKMRYLFKPEIEMFLDKAGLSLIGCEEWETGKEPSFDSWGVCFIGKKR